MMYEELPWGSFTVLQTDSKYQVKKLSVNPGVRLSLQSHKFRSEHWFIVSGTALVELEDSKFAVDKGGLVDIPLGARHRITCKPDHPLISIEVQTGSSFDENDIIRCEDEFGRN